METARFKSDDLQAVVAKLSGKPPKRLPASIFFVQHDLSKHTASASTKFCSLSVRIALTEING